MPKIIYLFNDQLNLDYTSIKACDKKNDLIFMGEFFECFNDVKHHKKKITFFILAMREFYKDLKKNGYNIQYYKLPDTKDLTAKDALKKLIDKQSKASKVDGIICTHPKNYNDLLKIKEISNSLGISLEILEDDHFLSDLSEFKKLKGDKKSLLMETFYRKMRLKYKVMMEKDDYSKPLGGKWNYDKDNRKPPTQNLNIPKRKSFLDKKQKNDFLEVKKIVEDNFSDHFGDIEPFDFAITKTKASEALDLFLKENIESFGPYQDAMVESEPFMYHSLISMYINIGFLKPIDCIRLCEETFLNKGSIDRISSYEGFIRQILGWREYIRCVYWDQMPGYQKLNFLKAKNKLPSFYWDDSKTKMNCLKNCIKETKNNAYAHHIQRLMVLGNFALIYGVDPKFVNEWFLIVYLDAYQWVELPNVTGMALFADGGVVGTKPYASSGAYINKMSNYCKNCSYDVKLKVGEKACPFNYLYWDFLIRNYELLSSNHRMRMIYATLNKMDPKKIESIKKSSEEFKEKVSKS